MTAGPDVKMVAYESNNKMENIGREPWKKETGLLSIWILGMFNPSPEITIVVPFVAGPEDQLGPVANDSYFGKVPADRLVDKDGVLYFSGDGKYRSKIGLSPKRAKTVLGSYDAVNGVLTIVQYNKPEGVEDYVNSMWQIQDQPYPRRRGQLLQRWADLAGRQAARPVLRAGDVLSGRGPGPGREHSPHPSHGSLRRQRGAARSDREGNSRRDHRADQIGACGENVEVH